MRSRGKIWIALIACIAVLSGCSAKWHIDQAVKKGAIIKSDTVYQEKTIITKGDSTTIFVPVTRLRDSLVTVYQDRVKISYKTIHDTLRFHVQCPNDTIRISVPVAVNTEIDCPPRSPFWRNLALALVVVCVLLLVFKK